MKSFITVSVTLAICIAGYCRAQSLAHRHAATRAHLSAHVRRSCRSRASAASVYLPEPTTLAATVTPTYNAPVSEAANTAPTDPGPVGGLVNVISAGSCGATGATVQITALSGPNGHIDFLNCGLTTGGWTPPLLHIDSIITAELSQVAYDSASPFAPCKDFIQIFENYGAQHGIPSIILASFAMQESGCVPDTVGGAGEQGLMQITVDKCGGAPGGNCRDPDFNIQQGAQFLSDTINSFNGDLLRAIGHYNGWYGGLTYDEATEQARNGNCREQNNLDYLHQMLNGWTLGVDAYNHNPPLGKYFNLNICSN